jgi:hypothetical protein
MAAAIARPTKLDRINLKPANYRSRTCECMPIPVLKPSLILLASCPGRGRFLEAVLLGTERNLAGPGRPGTVDELVAKVERREVPRPTSLGARGWRYQLREVGTLLPPPRVPRKHPGASRRSIPSRRSREGLANLGRFAPRECEAVAV